MGAIILAGGKSERMGTPKADMKLGEKSLLEWVLKPLKAITDDILIVSRIPPESAPEDIRLIQDELPEAGPLAGLQSGLKAAKDELNFVTGCDTPFLAVALIQALLEKADGFDAVIPVEARGKMHPLCAVYSKACLKPIAAALASQRRRISAFFPAVRVSYIDSEDLKAYDEELNSLVNVNTPEDYEKAAAILKSLYGTSN